MAAKFFFFAFLSAILIAVTLADSLCSPNGVENRIIDATPAPKRFDVPDAVHTLLDNISDDLTDALDRLGKLLTGQASLPTVLVDVVKDVIKILGSVVAALGQIVGLRGK